MGIFLFCVLSNSDHLHRSERIDVAEEKSRTSLATTVVWCDPSEAIDSVAEPAAGSQVLVEVLSS